MLQKAVEVSFCYPSPPFRNQGTVGSSNLHTRRDHLSQTDSPRNIGSPAQAGDAVIEVRDVRYAVGGRAIFDGLDVTARRGRITAFMGPSGTGKTTLL